MKCASAYTKLGRNPIIHCWDMEIMLFTKWRPSAILNLPKLPFLSRYLYSHFIIHLHCKFRVDQSIWRRDITNITFNMAFVRHLEFLKFQFCVKSPFSEWKSASAYQIWSKSDNSQLHLRTKRLNLKFEISLETWRWDCNLKIAVLVTWPVSAHIHFRSKFLNKRPIWRRDIAENRFSIWRPSAILNLQNFDFLLNVHPDKWSVHLHTKFGRNRMIHYWDMEIMLFSKWRPSAILDLLWRHHIITWHHIFV